MMKAGRQAEFSRGGRKRGRQRAGKKRINDGVLSPEDTEKGSQKGWRVGSKGGRQSQREEFSGDSVLERE
jgi:hypothetical protein